MGMEIMELKGKYKLSYTLNRELKDFTISVELKQIEGVMKPGQNVWEGYATLDGQPYEKYNLSKCVDAKSAAEKMGHKLRDEIKEKGKKDGMSFRIKKEEVV
jgi:hypothetical protein